MLYRKHWYVVAFLSAVAGHTMQAQQGNRPASDSTLIARSMQRVDTKSDSAAVIAAAAIADTGRMTPGYRDLSRYNTPGYCVAAIQGVESAVWRRQERVSVAQGSPQDTAPTAAISIGKKCMSQLPDVQRVDSIWLFDMMRLALYAGDTAKMKASISRQLQLVQNDEARGAILHDALDELLDNYTTVAVSHPARVELAKGILRQIDDLKEGARVARFEAHRAMYEFITQTAFDTADLMHEAMAMRAISQSMTPDERKEVNLNSAYSLTMDSITVAWYRHDPNVPTMLRKMVQPEIDKNPALANSVQMVMLNQVISQYDKPTPAITGKFWFPSNAAHTVPAPGRVTLVTQVQKGDGVMTPQLAGLLRLWNKYHAAGLDIVLVTKTQGYSWSSPPQKPDDEAKTDAWYFLNYLKLPFTLIVDEAPVTKRPDGRLVHGRITFENEFPLPGGVLIGRDGRVYTTWIGLSPDGTRDAFIRQALATH
jgi:hypothetical protein